MSTYVPPALRRLVAQRALGFCEYCLIHQDDTSLGCQIEHIISEKHGGQTIEANLAFACVFCNRYKGTDLGALSPTTGQLVRLYHPRTDLWQDHFHLDGVQIKGQTEIGTVTAKLLLFNHPDRLLERQVLATLRRYPSEIAQRLMRH